MRLIIIFFFLLASFVLSFSEDLVPFTEEDLQTDIECIPEDLEASFQKALEYYPELKEQRIRFKNANIKTTLNVRPTIASILFNKKENREYVIRINNSSKKEDILIKDIPFNARVGLFGHELAHIVDYKSRNFFEVFACGVGYNFPGYKEKYEKRVDRITVEAGLGWQLYDWATYIQDHPKVPETYKLFKKQFYMEEEDILEVIKEVNLGNVNGGL